MRIRLDLGYDGTDFSGWQVQPGKRTVQGVLEEALKELLGEKVSVVGSGRTDAGVHARRQVAAFSVGELKVPPERIALALRSFLPSDVVVYESKVVSEDFHPRRDCREKVYRYFFNWGEPHPILERYSLFVSRDVWEKVEKLAYSFDREGRFARFACNRGDDSHLTDRTWQVKVVVGRLGDTLGFVEFRSRGFLYKMVRRMVGLLLDVCEGRHPLSVIEEVFKGSIVEWSTAPSRGLFLWEVAV